MSDSSGTLTWKAVLRTVITPPRSIVIDPSVCVSVCLSVRQHISRTARPFRTKLCVPVAVARSSSGGVALRYVLPVLWMTSRLAVVGATAINDVAIPGRILMSMNACCEGL